MTDHHVPALLLGLAGLALIVFGLIWYFLAPARRPAVERVRHEVRERMRPILVVPPSPEVAAYAAGRPLTRDEQRAMLDTYPRGGIDFAVPVVHEARERIRHGLTADGHVSVESRYAALDAAGWQPGTDGNGLPDVAPTGEGATVDWSPSATAAVVGQSEDMTDEAIERTRLIEAQVRAEVVARLDAVETPPAIEVKGIDDFTDDEIDDARWGEEFRRLDAALAFASWTFMHNLAAKCGPAAAVDVLAAQHRAEVRAREAARQAAAWATGEGRLVDATPRKRPPTGKQIKRQRQKDNRNRGRIDRVLAEVGAS